LAESSLTRGWERTRRLSETVTTTLFRARLPRVAAGVAEGVAGADDGPAESLAWTVPVAGGGVSDGDDESQPEMRTTASAMALHRRFALRILDVSLGGRDDASVGDRCRIAVACRSDATPVRLLRRCRGSDK
jgi:hypothetical protein